MAEDAFGYGVLENGTATPVPEKRKRILIVDDINDTGKTFQWIIDDWQDNCLSKNPAWKQVWDNNVRFAVLTENPSVIFSPILCSRS